MTIHIVLYQPKSSLCDADVLAFRSVLEQASREIETIRQVRIGKTVDLGIGYEDRSSGQKFDYVAIFEFESTDGLRAYMAHPAHMTLAEQFWKHCERTMILDVEAEDPTARG